MRSVTYSMSVSLDGYIVGPDGGFDWTPLDENVFRFWIDEIREAEAAALGLIDEYRAMVYPVLVGGGIPFFPQHERRVDLELVETRTFSSRFVYLHYRVAR
jgi:dihydrofolate reductase